jgi:hypothetical protein
MYSGPGLWALQHGPQELVDEFSGIPSFNDVGSGGSRVAREVVEELTTSQAARRLAEEAPHIALGLRNQGLAATAERIGAIHFLYGDFRQRVIDAAKSPTTKFSVVLDGMDGATPKTKVLNAVEDGLENGISNSFTNWEMSVLQTHGRLPDVDFYLNGKLIPNPF